ncbi:MAG: hypothetical protein SFU98_14055 [Leptospiraceae bacterium]|nr:hypothetical protein [Leptospiraceae bacterium]
MKAEPWNITNCPDTVQNKEDWSKRCKEWTEELETKKEFSIRTHYPCPKCRFLFLFRTSYYSLSHTADITNYGICCNPDCKHEWKEYS